MPFLLYYHNNILFMPQGRLRAPTRFASFPPVKERAVLRGGERCRTAPSRPKIETATADTSTWPIWTANPSRSVKQAAEPKGSMPDGSKKAM